MPSEHSPAGSRERWPDWRQRLADDLGEDPGRFLDLPGAEQQALRRDTLVRARIEGIDRRKTLAAWRAYERRRAAERGAEPRDGIMRALDAVEDALDRGGARRDADEIGDHAERHREALANVDLDAGEATWLDEDGEEYQRNATHITSSSLVSRPSSDAGDEEVEA